MDIFRRFPRWWANRRAGPTAPPPADTRPCGHGLPAGRPPDGGSTTTTGPGGAAPDGGAAGGTRPAGGRLRGEPPSANGASSLHLVWDLPGELVAVAATLEVREPPTVDRLYFWALQVEFTGEGRRGGAGHLGLQFHPDFPGCAAVNWGGYDGAGRVLDGTDSLLPSSVGNPHTRNFDWHARRGYRLSIERAPDDARPGGGRTAWRGTVTDLVTGRATVVRDLFGRGSRLGRPMVWSEVFARCEHPSTEVRWSDLEGTTPEGRRVRPASVRVNYQSHDEGGCANTNASVDGDHLVQRTATVRRTPLGTQLMVPAR